MRGIRNDFAAANTLSRAVLETLPRSFNTRSTVDWLTPAISAISLNRADFLRQLASSDEGLLRIRKIASKAGLFTVI
jgi:hypothetical protein